MSDRAASEFRVATLNLWGWFGDWPHRLRLLEQCWPEVAADLLLVQEARFTAGRDQALEVARTLDYPHFVQGRAHTDAEGEEGVAILSRVALDEVRIDELPTSEPRRCLISATARFGSTSVRFASAHTVFAPQEARDGQIEAVCGFAGERVVVGGDLNAEPPTVLPRAAEGNLRDSLEREEATWPVSPETFAEGWRRSHGTDPHFSLAPRRLDYLLSRGLEVAASQARPLGDARRGFVSDHAVVWADYRPDGAGGSTSAAG